MNAEDRILNTECLKERSLHDSTFGVRYSIFKFFSPGFTLLELMISIAIIGIMVFILMGVLRLGFRSVEAGEKKIESLERVRASLNMIDSQIQSGFPLIHEENGEKKVFFKGDRTSLEFATNYSIWDGAAGYTQVSYRVAEGDWGKRSLQASEGRVGQEFTKEIKLLDQFDELVFEYYYKDPTEEEGKWIDQWTEGTFLPEKIRILWTVRGKAHSLIIPIKTGGTLAAQGVVRK